MTMNIWKWSFIILLLFNILAVGSLYIFLSGNYDDADVEVSDNASGEHVVILQNHTVESLLNSFLQEDAANNIEVSIDQTGIELLSENEYLNMNFDTSFNLNPQITDSSIIFEISDISVGQLPLTEDMLYTLIRTSADLPDGITFSTDTKALIIDKSLFDESSDLSLDIDQIDYQNNAWYFSIENLN